MDLGLDWVPGTRCRWLHKHKWRCSAVHLRIRALERGHSGAGAEPLVGGSRSRVGQGWAKGRFLVGE